MSDLGPVPDPIGEVVKRMAEERDAAMQRVEQLEQLVRKFLAEGPFYAGIDDDFCAVCSSYLLLAGDVHEPDCAYVALRRELNMPEAEE